MMSKKVAFLTGASRGIGAACAVELAAAGYDVAITARTVTEGERREHSSTLKSTDTTALPGSLESTANRIRAAGGECLTIAADLLDAASLGAAVGTVLEKKGRIDVLVHNGRYIGPGHMDQFLDTPIELLRKQMEGNLFAPLIINKLVLPSMVARGNGTIVNITSAAAYAEPGKAAGEGGWGLGYGMSKGAFHRVAGVLNVELAARGIRVFNVQPGLVATERIAQDMVKFGISADGAPMEMMGKVVRWLCTDAEADKFRGQNIEAQYFCHERGLLPGWAGPKKPGSNAISYDLSAYKLHELERSHIETGHA
jgi:NAD(P)-dependent dehydrogenase (short-subunit alcohol dehydrogenase family)